jgi:lipopolysaccharide transport system ATP-binding protein
VEKFLDTPVKRYSSGMYVRLAFAVAAHLEPEILIVDEVLAVGDMEFQKKCLGKMKDVATGGRTVLFVSHNLKAIEQLCERTIYIKSGSVCSDGKPSEIIALYMQATEPLTGAAVRTELLPGLFLNRLHFEPSECLSKSAVSFVLEISAASPQTLSSLELLFFNKQSERVSLIDLRTPNLKYTLRNGEKLTIDGSIASLNLVEGDYLIGLCIRSNDLWRDHLNLLRVRLLPPPIPQGLTPVDSQWLGVVAFDHRLKVRID